MGQKRADEIILKKKLENDEKNNSHDDIISFKVELKTHLLKEIAKLKDAFVTVKICFG